jgi:uncharacterized protein with HEPN domain
MKDDAVYLRHIRECIRRIEEDVAGGREEFFTSHMIQDAVLRNLQTLAEATQRLSDTAKTKHPEMGWEPVAALRNILVHNYLGIDLEAIWGIVQRDLPELKRVIAVMLAETRK